MQVFKISCIFMQNKEYIMKVIDKSKIKKPVPHIPERIYPIYNRALTHRERVNGSCNRLQSQLPNPRFGLTSGA